MSCSISSESDLWRPELYSTECDELLELPEDCLVEICSHLHDIADILNVQATCTALRTAVSLCPATHMKAVQFPEKRIFGSQKVRQTLRTLDPWFHRCAKARNSGALRILSVIAAAGIADDTAGTDPFRWLDQAMDLGDPLAYALAATFCLRGPKKDPKLALQFLEEADGIPGDPCLEILYLLGVWHYKYGHNSKSIAVHYLGLAAEMGHADAALLVGLMYYYGAEDVQVNYDLAEAAMLRAATLGHPAGLYNYGWIKNELLINDDNPPSPKVDSTLIAVAYSLCSTLTCSRPLDIWGTIGNNSVYCDYADRDATESMAFQPDEDIDVYRVEPSSALLRNAKSELKEVLKAAGDVTGAQSPGARSPLEKNTETIVRRIVQDNRSDRKRIVLGQTQDFMVAIPSLQSSGFTPVLHTLPHSVENNGDMHRIMLSYLRPQGKPSCHENGIPGLTFRDSVVEWMLLLNSL